MIYLDNAATTNFKPFTVKFCTFCNMLKCNTANPGRSGHRLSVKMGNKIFKARDTFAKYFNLSPFDVIFTSGCTEALNLAIIGTVKKGGHIITTTNEHNSVLRTLEKIKTDYNVEITFVESDNFFINPEKIEKSVKNSTYMIIINHTSNVTGATVDLKSIGEIAKKHHLIFVVDGAQSVGHQKINLKECNINFLAIAGHKGIHGLPGSGALLINFNQDLIPIKYGGTGIDSMNTFQSPNRPEGLEAGTMNYIGILAMEQGLIFTMKNFDKINYKISSLTNYLISQLNTINRLKVFSPENNSSGVVSFIIEDMSSSEISDYLNDNFNIFTRSGLHCAPLVHKNLGTQNSGLCRVSIDFTNTKRQIDKLVSALKQLSENKN